MSFVPKGAVVGFESFVALHGDCSPMMEGQVEGLRASSAYEDLSEFAALLSDGGNPTQATKGIEVSQAYGIVGMAQERSEDEAADAGQGGEDGGIRGFRLARLDLLEPFFKKLV